MKRFSLLILTCLDIPDYEAQTEAENKEQAALNFLRDDFYLRTQYGIEELFEFIDDGEEI
jgi:hypothetical protein